jgi:hypothetical protein
MLLFFCNSVILIVQIEELRKEGKGAWEAVLEATQHRTRPIILDRRRRKPRSDSDLTRGILGTNGIRVDGWHYRRNSLDACLSAGALRRLVPDQGAD